MKFLHLSDLHLGKKVNEFPMLDDQAYILDKILNITEAESPDGVIIAGDVYDKSIPLTEAVSLFDSFIFHLSKKTKHIFLISGNHDSAERLAFASRLLNKSGIHISPIYDGNIKPISLSDEYGEFNVFLLPFIKPSHVRRFYDSESIESYTDAMQIAIKNMQIDSEKRNILVTHQFVTGATRSDSEDMSVGGIDNVDASVFDCFDYVALGHLHGPQNCGTERIRYCGSPLKYSFSEANDNKSVTIVEFAKKGNLQMRTVALTPLHDMREIRGTYQELMSKSFYENTSYNTDYMHITLTDENDIPDAISKLRTVYHNLMKLDYDNARTAANRQIAELTDIEYQSPQKLFSDFYELQNNQRMSTAQKNLVNRLIEEIMEEEK